MVRLAVVAFPFIYLVSICLSGDFQPAPFWQHIKPLVHSDTDNGFPSDHTSYRWPSPGWCSRTAGDRARAGCCWRPGGRARVLAPSITR